MIKTWLITGSYSNGQLRGGTMICGTKQDVDSKAREILFNWFCSPNNYIGEIYYSDLDDINSIKGGYYFNSDNGYDNRKITKMSKNYIATLETLINS